MCTKSLLRIDELNELENLVRMRPEALTLADGVMLEQILRAKADELNRIFQTGTWTPRKIDKILWAYREKNENSPSLNKKLKFRKKDVLGHQGLYGEGRKRQRLCCLSVS